MLEFRQQGDSYALGYGGDVFNTAVYSSRLGLDVKFFTATGDDHYSQYLLDAWKKEGVTTNTVRVLANQKPSLYIIETDDAGERTFYYWRETSPFIQWLVPGDYVENLPGQLASCQYIYFSGISLALLSGDDRALLLQLLSSYRNSGGQVGFDPNYRPRLWQSSSEAATWIDRAYEVSDIAFPSYDDEALLRTDSSQENLIKHIQNLGVDEIVMKNGPHGAIVNIGGDTLSIAGIRVDTVIDTTAAGDSFNSGYLATRLRGGDAVSAAEAGCRVAAQVIQHRGAVIPPDVQLSRATF